MFTKKMLEGLIDECHKELKAKKLIAKTFKDLKNDPTFTRSDADAKIVAICRVLGFTENPSGGGYFPIGLPRAGNWHSKAQLLELGRINTQRTQVMIRVYQEKIDELKNM